MHQYAPEIFVAHPDISKFLHLCWLHKQTKINAPLLQTFSYLVVVAAANQELNQRVLSAKITDDSRQLVHALTFIAANSNFSCKLIARL